MNRRFHTWLTVFAFVVFFAVSVGYALLRIFDPIYVLYVHSSSRCLRFDFESDRVTVARIPGTSKDPRIPMVMLYGVRPFTLHRDVSTLREMYDRELDGSFFNLWDAAAIRNSYRGFGYAVVTRPAVRGPLRLRYTTTFDFVCILPTWIVVAISALPLILPIRRFVRRRLRLRKNLCPECAYDLRASTGLCPECGCPSPRRSHGAFA